jgi:tetratricopeptide (TPR) repeat protein
MILLLALLGLSAHADTGLLEETRGVVGRGLSDIPGSAAARELGERGLWQEAAVAWGELADSTGMAQARVWQMVASWRAEDPAAARDAAVSAMAMAPGDQTVLLAATWLLNEDGHHRRAAKLLRRFPDTSADREGALILQMRALMMADKTRRALRLRERALAAGSEDAWFWFELSLEDAWRGLPEAEQHMRRALRAEGASPVHYQLLLHHLSLSGDAAGAVRAGIEGMERFPEDAGLGIAVLELCQTSAGRQALERLVAVDPGRAVARALMGTLLLVGEEPAAAALHLQAAVDNGEDRPSIYRLLSEAFTAAEERGSAWTALTGGLSRHPENLRLWTDLFDLGREQGRLGEALQLSERAWQDGARWGFLVQFSYRAASDLDEQEAALLWSERGVRIDTIRQDALAWRALSLSRLGRGTEALAAYEDALAQTPDDPTLLNNLAWFLLDPGEGIAPDPQRARALVTRALSGTDYPVPAYLDTLARACWLLGEREEAVEVQRRAARLDPTDVDIQSTLERYERGEP